MLSSARALSLLLVVAGAALRGASSSVTLKALTFTLKTEIIQVCEYGHVHTHHPHFQYTITEPEREWVAKKCVEYCDVTSIDLTPRQKGCLRTCVNEGHEYILKRKMEKVQEKARIIAYRKMEQLQIIAVQSSPNHDHAANIAHESKLTSMDIAEQKCKDQGDDCVADEYTHRRKQVKEAEHQLDGCDEAGAQTTTSSNGNGYGNESD